MQLYKIKVAGPDRLDVLSAILQRHAPRLIRSFMHWRIQRITMMQNKESYAASAECHMHERTVIR